MPLVTRISELATRIATEFKSVRTELNTKASNANMGLKDYMVSAATTVPITLSGHQVIDGWNFGSFFTILVKDQDNPAENGIYTVQSGAWTRANGFGAGFDTLYAAQVRVRYGAVNGGTVWATTWSNQKILGIDPLLWRRVVTTDDTAPLAAIAASSAAAIERLQAGRGPNLVTNGSGQMKTNYNFSSMAFDMLDAPTGATGCFIADTSSSTRMSDEIIPVDPTIALRLDVDARQVARNGPMYIGLAPFDAWGNAIVPYTYMAQTGTLTTLSADLKPGDTVVRLTSTANWYNGTGGGHLRTIIFWDYVDPGGKAWAANTYSRNYYPDAYAGGGVTNATTITLRTPWEGPLKPAGTQLSNGSSGSGYMYIAASNVTPPTTWTRYTGRTQPGVHPSGEPTAAGTRLPMMTAGVKVLILPNYQQSGDPRQAFANIGLREITDPAVYRSLRTSAFTVPNNALTQLPPDSVPLDTDGMHNSGDGFAYIRRAGTYRIDFQAAYNSVAGGGIRDAYIYVNTTQRAITRVPIAANAGSGVSVSTSLVTDLNAGDFVRFFVFQNSGANVAIVPGTQWTFASIEMIRAA